MFRSSFGSHPQSARSRTNHGTEKALNKETSRALLIIAGPTAAGKNQLALRLTAHFSSEIINADSRQLYRELPIGTGQPTERETKTVPHHLYGLLSAHESFTAADYEKRATQVISGIHERRNLPVVVGGTGFYIKALLKGLWEVPPRDANLRKRLRSIQEQKGKTFLHSMLNRVDPVSAEAIPPNDVYRIVRALEIYFQSGKRRSDLSRPHGDRWNSMKFFLNPPRAELQQRIRARTEEMFARGWVEEVKHLIEKYSDFEATPASASLGYRLIIRHLRGEMSLEECKEAIIRQTNQYAKRQTTWFRNQDSFVGVAGEMELYKIIDVLKFRAERNDEC